MKRQLQGGICGLLIALLAGAAFAGPPRRALKTHVPQHDIGVIVGSTVQEEDDICHLYSRSIATPIIQAPLFTPYHRDGASEGDLGYWYNLVEEATFANVDFVAYLARGDKACPQGNTIGNAPTSYATNLGEAIRRRGADFKVALFDDTGAYKNQYNQCDKRDATHIPLPDPASYDDPESTLRFWWNYKWKPFFEKVPDDLRYKYQGRPVIFVWGDVPSFSNLEYAPQLFARLRANFQAEFGQDPFIIVSSDWSSIGRVGTEIGKRVEAVVDGIQPWIKSGGTPYAFNGGSGLFKASVINGSYSHCDNTTFSKDRRDGQTLEEELVNATGADIVLLEAHTNVAENAGTYRASRIVYPPCGGCLQPSGQDWSDWPNQSLNLLRDASTHRRKTLTFEAEGADRIYSTALHNLVFRRDGDAETRFDEGRANWDVRLLGNNSFMYRGIKLPEGAYTAHLCYSSQTDTDITLSFEGLEGSVEENRLLPGTEGEHVCTTFPESFSTDRYDVTVTMGGDADVWIDSLKLMKKPPS